MKKITFTVLCTLFVCLLHAQTPVFLWAKGLAVNTKAIAADAAGNTYTTGTFSGTVDFDPGSGTANLTATGQGSIFVLKLDISGHYVWAKKMGGSQFAYGYAIAVDTAGNVFTGGYFGGTVDFDPSTTTVNLTSNGGYDAFVVKLNASGNYVWAKRWGAAGDEYVNGIVLDEFDNVYTVGSFQGTVDFDPSGSTANISSNSSSNDAFVSKLDSSGVYKWAKASGSVNDDFGMAITLDHSGHVITTGLFTSTVDFDPTAVTLNITSKGGYDVFVSKFDGAGNFVTAVGFGGSSDDYSTAVVTDHADNIYTSGYFSGTVDFDPSIFIVSQASAGNKDIFISKLDPFGNYIWAKTMGGSGGDFPNGLAIDRADNLISTGYFSSIADFDPGSGTATLTSTGGTNDVFISEIDTSGNYISAKRFGGSSNDQGFAIAVDTSGNIFSTGMFTGTVDFDPDSGTFTMTSSGISYSYIHKYGPFTTVGLQELPATSGSLVYPNPVGDALSLQLRFALVNGSVKLFNTTGQTVQAASHLNGTDFTFDVTKLTAGIYVIETTSRSNSSRTVFIKK
jgi:hypothetical protein